MVREGGSVFIRLAMVVTVLNRSSRLAEHLHQASHRAMFWCNLGGQDLGFRRFNRENRAGQISIISNNSSKVLSENIHL